MSTILMMQGLTERALFTTGAGAVNGVGYALPTVQGQKGGWTLSWKTTYTGGPSAVSVAIQGANNDVDAEYANLDTSTAQAGELKITTNVATRFIRARQVSRTGGTDSAIDITLN